jgi:hypothetical protein
MEPEQVISFIRGRLARAASVAREIDRPDVADTSFHLVDICQWQYRGGPRTRRGIVTWEGIVDKFQVRVPRARRVTTWGLTPRLPSYRRVSCAGFRLVEFGLL